MAFGLGNPTLNPAVLVFLGFTLGWSWAALRLVLGLVIVLAGAALASRLRARLPQADDHEHTPESTGAVEPLDPAQLPLRWLKSLARLTLYLVPEYILLVTLLGAARAWLFPVVSPDMGNPLVILLLFAVVGALFVIPTAGEIPVIQTLMAYGLGPAPAGALLLTLAPVSLPSLAMVGRVFPARTLVLVFGLVVVVGIVAGSLAYAFGLS